MKTQMSEMQIVEVNEKDAQGDYEQLMAEAAAKRAEYSKASTNKAAAKAQEEEMLGNEKGKKADNFGHNLSLAAQIMMMINLIRVE